MTQEANKTTYWKSLNELAHNDEYKQFVEREFPENASELKDGLTRRTFLRIMGASIALAGFAACRRPVQKIIPYSHQPEEVIPGVPLFYASAMPFQDVLSGLLIENHEGRPTKIEGNTMHPASDGNSSKYNQAATLGMYDQDRSRSVRKDGERSSYTLFQSFCKEHFSDTDRSIAFISEANSSPTYSKLKQKTLNKFSNAQWVTYEPFGEDNALEGTNIAFGQRLRTVPHFDKSAVIVALDDDFLNPAANKNIVETRKDYAKARKVTSTEDDMARVYAVESTFTLTGSNADNRLRIKSSELPLFVDALGAELSSKINGLSGFTGDNKFSDHKWISELAKDLMAHRGSSVLTLGNEHAPELHAAVAVINNALGNSGNTVSYRQLPYLEDQNNREAFADITRKIKNGEIDTVVLIGTNPVYNAPADLKFGEALSNANTVVNLSDYYDETAKMTHWHVNRSHFLESWGDGYSFTGIRSVIQPQIEPLFGGKSELEFLNTIVNGTNTGGYKLVQDTWREYHPTGFKNKWETILHDGLDGKDTFTEIAPTVSGGFANALKEFMSAQEESEGMELVIRPDATVFDGRFANNGWLQELPDPMTKITWDNVALISQKTADQLGVKAAGLGEANVELLTLNVNGKKAEVPAWVQPGHADDSITITVGFGRKGIGSVADDAGVDTYPLRTTDAMLYATNINVSKVGELYPISCTQDHSSMEGRSLLRYATLEEYRDNPEFSSYEHAYNGAELPGSELAEERGSEHLLSMFTPQAGDSYPDYQPQWGMAIDLNTCVGCGTCTIACQAENNIPVVGKKQVGKGREMHWIRTDRYFEGDVDNPKALHQPVPCMMCELAPCEQVCPVAATTHSDDGMNQMTYNRCIGTRYCLNNCPYKVRRFNFFNFTEEFLTTGDDPEVIQMAMNPNVTVRFRGVMEKCSYCVQRVNRAKIQTQIKTDGSMKPPDGMVQTACQQACPSDAIYFGDLTDDNSEVSVIKRNNRNYLLLEELDTRPRTSYLAKVRNPNPQLA